eukprot:8737639-Alexandrium_andersonii.AAC.1
MELSRTVGPLRSAATPHPRDSAQCTPPGPSGALFDPVLRACAEHEDASGVDLICGTPDVSDEEGGADLGSNGARAPSKNDERSASHNLAERASSGHREHIASLGSSFLYP